MANQDFSFKFNKNDELYKIWLAGVNHREFERITRSEDCELILVQSICDGIMLKISEEARLASTTSVQRPMRSFLMASQLTIGLIYVHKQQVKFLYDLASRFNVPKLLLIEKLPLASNVENESCSPEKKALKRKRTNAKKRQAIKRKFSLEINEEIEDIENLTRATIEVLQNSVVARNDDISIREFADDPDINEADMANEVEEGLMPSFKEEPVDVPIDMLELESPQQNRTELNDRSPVYRDTKKSENAETTASEPVNELNDEPVTTIHFIDDMGGLSKVDVTANKISSRKRKRRQPFRDDILNINVKQNMKTVSTTQRHLKSKDDSVSNSTRLNHLYRNIYNNPTRVLSYESLRQFKLAPMSHKLSNAFKRMTLTSKTEEANYDMVNEFLSNGLNQPELDRADLDQPEMITPVNELSVVDAACDDVEVSFQMTNCDFVDSPPIQPDPVQLDSEEISNDFVEPPNIFPHISVELSSSIQQILLSTETPNPLTRCDTESQEIRASRTRQNRLDWGAEAVLQKLISLWNSGIYPIGMKEIMQLNNLRMSAATAFFSVMELNSARIGLITLEKCPNANSIFNITKSPKLVELQGMM